MLVASRLAGVDRVYAMGGAQAIAALAYGTESMQAVDKIAGPGNVFVALAKQKLFGVVGIDQIAGPTETVIIADETARPGIVAIDLLAQAEHDPMASAILITDSRELAEAVAREAEALVERSPRRAILQDSVANNCGAIVAADIGEAIELANEYAPEHLVSFGGGSLALAAGREERRRHIPGRSERGGDWGLRFGPEPRDADRRIGEVLVAGVGRGLRKDLQPIRPQRAGGRSAWAGGRYVGPGRGVGVSRRGYTPAAAGCGRFVGAATVYLQGWLPESPWLCEGRIRG